MQKQPAVRVAQEVLHAHWVHRVPQVLDSGGGMELVRAASRFAHLIGGFH